MSTKYPQGIITPTPPYKSTTAQNFSGVWTLEQLANNFYYYKQAIANSLRFRSSASAYLSRTPASAGNRTTWTWSAWVKRGTLGGIQNIFGASDGSGNNECYIELNSDALRFYSYIGAYDLQLQTTAVYRDPSAWYHIVVVSDTTQATASNRAKIYVNGVQVTSFSITTYPSQNYNTYVNTTQPHVLGRDQLGIRYFDGYLAEVNFIDGLALDPSYFGQISTVTGVWSPAPYTGAYGTNGFRLNFSNGTSTTTLCYDYSGNGNNWTPNNISLTAGSTYDSMLDSPTNYDNGGNGVGNYAVLNPLNMESGLTMYWANLYGYTASSWKCCTSTIAVTSGKWYWEVLYTSGSSYGMFGISNTAFDASTGGFWSKAGGYAYYSTGDKYIAGSTSSYGASYSGGDVIGFALDMDAGTLTCYKNNVSQGVLSSGISGAVIPAFAVYNGGFQPTFGQRPFAYTPPSGYKSLCTYNLPTPTIQNGSNFMAATLYTGNGATQTLSNAVNGISFQPDFIWIKSRSAAYDHRLQNSVVGMQGLLDSNSTAAEYTASSGDYPTVTSSGFTLPYGTNGLYYNGSGVTFVGWQWKAGGTAVTNTAGSITSSVSANTTSGFAVVTYTGTGSNATVGHGLGVAPSMIIVKTRSASGQDWQVYHTTLGQNKAIQLNYALPVDTATNYWYNGVTSSVFGINGAYPGINGNGNTYVAYCFAAIPGYSAFGSYTGNGSSDGPFVFLGFRPRWIMFKRTDGADNWYVEDTSRDTYNPATAYLDPNQSQQEYSGITIDFVSNGFKIRFTGTGINGSGGSYIYAAFAENPFNYSLAR